MKKLGVAMVKPGTRNIAITECEPLSLNQLIKNSGWAYRQYDWYNLSLREVKPELYKQPWLEVPYKMLYRLGDISDQIDWDQESRALYKESILEHASVLKIKEMDMDYIYTVIRDEGLEPDNFKRALRDHQLQALALYIKCGDAANFGEMRTGKTPPTIIYLWLLINKRKVDCALIIVPNNIKYLWYDELRLDLPDYIQVTASVIEGNKIQKAKLWREDKLFYIANYECVRADIEIVKESFNGKNFALVADECHRVKNTDAEQTKAIKGLSGMSKYTVLLSGTPVANKPHDVYEPISMISTNLLGLSIEHFKKHWAWTNTYEEVTSYKRGSLDEIHNRMATVSVRALRKNVHLDLGKIIQPQLLDMPEKLKKVYDRANNDFILELTTSTDKSRLFISNFLARLVRLQQLTDGYLPKLDPVTNQPVDYIWLDEQFGIPNLKIRFIDEWIKDYLYNGAKLVIFSRFVPILERLHKRYLEYGSQLIYGKTHPDDVMQYQKNFKENDYNKIMICNTVCSEGKDFCPCNFVIFFDRVWGLKDNTQAEDRVTGMNQKAESTIMPLVLRGTIDENLENIVLPEKRKNAAKVEDGIDSEIESYTVQDLFNLLQ